MLEQDIPIDIHTNKLYEWLLSRRHCSADWQKKAMVIREKINNAIQDMPSHPEITKLLSGTYINKFHCDRIVALLRETEADTKNMFGRYGSQRMKDWLEIIGLYEQDGVYLAEAANQLIKNVKYEVPNFKKQIAKCNSLKEECDKKELDYNKHENSARHDLESFMKQLGVKSNNPRKMKKELINRVAQLAEIYDKITKEVKNLKKVVEYHSALLGHTNPNFDKNSTVQIIRYIIESGNTTTYQYLYGEKPKQIIEPKLLIEDDDAGSVNGDGDGIDWGNEIDYGEIDYGVSLEESGIEVECNIGIGGGDDKSSDSGVAEGKQALTLLDNPETRTEFINQLLELESFAKMRLLEMQSESISMLVSNNQLQETTENVASMLDTIVVIKQLILDPTTTDLHNIKHSPRHVDKILLKLENKYNVVEKTIASREAVHERGLQAVEEARLLTPKMQLIIDKTKELQKDIEKDISKKYKGRPVNLMGGVSTL
ncbi:CDK5 regulatory subunit-associated protein 3-like [Nilaparvata lugens]|uniref:CDK5 regulatory subunit-associated protein 3-like n=1 Tax=Nilaparvata lugens TaxID=108931 RepID=UPI00193DF4D8|nr:CDK5 regulatory subunit-associated protein 3-like [Nilaparvata lugens]